METGRWAEESWKRGAPGPPHAGPGSVPTQVTHWHSPYFFAYFPTASSHPSMLADVMCGAIGCISFSWVSSGGPGGPGGCWP